MGKAERFDSRVGRRGAQRASARRLETHSGGDDTAMITLRSLSATLILVMAAAIGGQALAQSTAPPNLSQEQFDALVDATSKSVVAKLKAEGIGAQAPSAAKEGSFAASGKDEPDELALFLQQASRIMSAVPALGHSLAVFADGGQTGRGRATYLLLLALVVAAALAAEAILRRALAVPSEGLAANAKPERGLRSLHYLGLLALLDGLGVLAVWLVGRASAAMWFSGSTMQDRFAAGVLTAIVLWRLYAIVFRIILRPELAAARMCEVSDEEARRMYGAVSAFLLLAIVLRLTYHILVAVDAPADAIAAARVQVPPFLFLAFVWVVVRSKNAAREWLGGLGRVAPVAGFIGRHWVWLASLLFLALIATLMFGAISGRTGVPVAMILTLNLVVGLLIFETFLQALVRRLDSQLGGYTPAGDREKLADVVARCLRIAVLIGIIVLIGERWVVDVLGLVNAGAWDRLTRASQTAGITLFVAFVLWELFKYAAQAYVDRISKNASADGPAASRLDTLMQIQRAHGNISDHK
jgi:moderate conductance mechanosensitive channel